MSNIKTGERQFCLGKEFIRRSINIIRILQTEREREREEGQLESPFQPINVRRLWRWQQPRKETTNYKLERKARSGRNGRKRERGREAKERRERIRLKYCLRFLSSLYSEPRKGVRAAAAAGLKEEAIRLTPPRSAIKTQVPRTVKCEDCLRAYKGAREHTLSAQ